MIPRTLFSPAKGPSGPKGHRAYAIGDIHGCLELLEPLLAKIEAEIAEARRRKVSILFLGDLIDRGPSSAQVVERLRTYSPKGATTHFVMGNHEEVMLKVIEGDSDLLQSWLRFGGAETLRSYGLEPKNLAGHGDSAIESIRSAVPKEHVEFLQSFADSVSFGDYFFVHAGIRPGVDLAEQSEADLRWIRDPFLNDTGERGFVVVHGHTISNSVQVTSNRIGIDTGAFCTGTLSAIAIDRDDRWLIQASTSGAERIELDH